MIVELTPEEVESIIDLVIKREEVPVSYVELDDQWVTSEGFQFEPIPTSAFSRPTWCFLA